MTDGDDALPPPLAPPNPRLPLHRPSQYATGPTSVTPEFPAAPAPEAQPEAEAAEPIESAWERLRRTVLPW